MKDVATIIWEMAKADKSFDGLSLKAMYRKKADHDADDLRLALKQIVSTHIQKEKQPFNAQLTLADESDGESKYHKIFGGRAACKMYRNRPVNVSEQYCYADGSDWYEVTNPQTRMLIDAAIIPLDLKWKLYAPPHANNLVVSWSHWNLKPEVFQRNSTPIASIDTAPF